MECTISAHTAITTSATRMVPMFAASQENMVILSFQNDCRVSMDWEGNHANALSVRFAATSPRGRGKAVRNDFTSR